MVKNTKALKLVVCMSLIVALAISALGLSARATFENTHGNTGNQASDIVEIASTQVGYGEGYDGYTKYGDWYGLPYSDWCAMFVSWCANQAGVGTDVFPSFALCSAGADWFISQGRFHYAGSYTPQAGDLIFYSSYGNIYHVGLVTGSDGYNVYSIEGNYSEAVYNVSYPLSYGDIMGYATPAYETGYVAENVEEVSADYTPAVYEDDVYEEEVFEEESDSEEETDTFSDEEEGLIVFDTDSEEEDSDEYLTYEEFEEYFEETDSEDYEDVTESDFDVYSDDETTDEDKPDDYISAIAGDVNGDGVVNSADALFIQRYLIGEESEDMLLLNADANMDGEITVEDALLTLLISVGAA